VERTAKNNRTGAKRQKTAGRGCPPDLGSRSKDIFALLLALLIASGVLGESRAMGCHDPEPAAPLMVRDFNPANGITSTTLNGGEDVITETPDFPAKTSVIDHSRDGVLVSTRQITLNNLGQVDLTTISGSGIPATTINPTFRADGSIEAFSITIGGATASATFAQDGTLSGFTHPLLGNLSVSHTIANGTDALTIDGTTTIQSLDGTASSLSGAGVMARDRATTVDGTNFAETIVPATGAPTTLGSNAAGAKVSHQYAAGANPQTSWLPGGLPQSVTFGRGGAASFEYSNDGAMDLVSYAWPPADSAGFPYEGFYGGSVGFAQRDGAGNISEMSDPAGDRLLSYEKNRLTGTDWLTGELAPYKVVREYDSNGRLHAVVLHRNGEPIHDFEVGYTGASDEVSSVATNGFTAAISRDAASRHVTGFSRGGVTQSWQRAAAGRITSANSSVAGAPSFAYTDHDAKGRRTEVNTNRGNWAYDYRGGVNGDGQLVSATSTGNDLGNFAYNFDGIGRRVEFEGNANNPLNQFVAIEHPEEPKNLYISADPDARLWINGVEAEQFEGVWTYPLAHPGEAGGWVPWQVKGVLEVSAEEKCGPWQPKWL